MRAKEPTKKLELLDETSPKVSAEELRDALNTNLRDALPTTALVLVFLFLFFAVSHALLMSGRERLIMTSLATATAFFNLGVLLVLRRHVLAPRWAHFLSALMSLLVLANTLTHLYITRDPLQTTNVLLVVISMGFFLFSTLWWGVVVSCVMLGWGVATVLIGPHPTWGHFNFAMVSALTISLLAHLLRLRTHRRLELLRLSDARHKVKLELALRSTERVQRALETTIDVGKHLASILDLEYLLNQIVELIKERYGYYFVGIFLVDEGGTYVNARAGTGDVGRRLCEKSFRVPLGSKSIIGWVAQNRQLLNVSNVDEDQRYVSVDIIPNTRSELALPLEVADKMLGVLDIQSDKVWAFNDDDARVLLSLAGQVAIAIQNASRYQVERQRRLFAEKLQDVGRALSHTLELAEVLDLILSKLAEIVPYDRGSVMLKTQEGHTLVVKAALGFPESAQPQDLRVPIKSGDVFEDMCKLQRPLLIPDVQERSDWQYVEDLPPARSWLGVPLILFNEVLGMLSLTRERTDPYTDEEVTLSAAFASQAAIALENARLYNDITQINTELEITVEQLKERSDDLLITYAQLERLDHTKSDFISVASHELRTPLTVLSGYSQILLDDAEIKAQPYKLQLVEGIKSGTDRLHTIVDSMLDMVKIDSRVMQLHPELFSMAMLIEGVHKKLKDALLERSLTLTLADMTSLPKVEIDVEAITKVFYQLLLNAVKYTPDGGKISVEGREIVVGNSDFPKGGVEIVVRDTGIGIDPSVHELIFAKFYQTGEVAVHSSGVTKFKGGGPGLGLAIAQGIVNAHAGQIWVESPGYDEVACPGSAFHVILPLTARVLLADDPAV